MEEVSASALGASFPKHRRLLKRKDFVRVQKNGAGAGSRNYVVIALAHAPEEVQPTRLGLVASRKTGNAVQRNRGKRVVREWFRLGYQHHEGLDVVVILRRGAVELSLSDARRELDNGLRRAIKKAMREARALA